MNATVTTARCRQTLIVAPIGRKMTALIPFTYDREVFRRRVIVKIEQDSEVLELGGRDQVAVAWPLLRSGWYRRLGIGRSPRRPFENGAKTVNGRPDGRLFFLY